MRRVRTWWRRRRETRAMVRYARARQKFEQAFKDSDRVFGR